MDKTIWKLQTTNATDFFGLRFLVALRWMFDARTFRFELKGIYPNSVTGTQANKTSKKQSRFYFYRSAALSHSFFARRQSIQQQGSL